MIKITKKDLEGLTEMQILFIQIALEMKRRKNDKSRKSK